MTDNGETIEMLKMLKKQALKSHNDTAVLEVKIDSFNFVLDEAIKALEQEPCEDAVNRQAVLDAINTYDKFGYTETGCFVREPKGDYVPYIHYDDVIKCIKNAPPVTPKEKTGHWEYVQYDGNPNIGNWHCSECNRIVCGAITATNPVYAYKYCPECGAKMQEVEDGNK